MADLERIVEMLGATAEVCGAEIKPNAMVVMAQDLAAYPVHQIEAALTRVRREVNGRFTLAAVMDRLSADDGRPGADEAWASALIADDEAETVVWTEEMAQAFFVAQPLLHAGDKVGARMAFRSAYERIVSEARASAIQVKWQASIGHDKDRRAEAITRAVTAGLLSYEATKHYLPAPETQEVAAIAGLLTGKTVTTKNRDFNSRLAEVRRAIVSAGSKTFTDDSPSESRAAEEARKQQAREAAENWRQQK